MTRSMTYHLDNPTLSSIFFPPDTLLFTLTVGYHSVYSRKIVRIAPILSSSGKNDNGIGFVRSVLKTNVRGIVCFWAIKKTPAEAGVLKQENCKLSELPELGDSSCKINRDHGERFFIVTIERDAKRFVAVLIGDIHVTETSLCRRKDDVVRITIVIAHCASSLEISADHNGSNLNHPAVFVAVLLAQLTLGTLEVFCVNKSVVRLALYCVVDRIACHGVTSSSLCVIVFIPPF